jgi:cyanophycin synthetase
MRRLSVGALRVLEGPSYYLEKPAVLFDLLIHQEQPRVGDILSRLGGQFSTLDRPEPADLGELAARLALEIGGLTLDLLPYSWASTPVDAGYKIAVEFLDPELTTRAVRLTVELLDEAAGGDVGDVHGRWLRLQEYFDKSTYGGPTIYSLLEAAARLGIPRLYLPAENLFQWGYGRNQVRGASTTFHVDSIKDTEFTCYKDKVKAFLADIGFPTPPGKVCRTVEDAERTAAAIGYPVVVKPVVGHKGHGVTTGIGEEMRLRDAARALSEASGGAPIIVEQHVAGTDHRLLTVGGRFVAALQRVPAHVVGDASHNIRELIDDENARDIRSDNARSPLARITVDRDLEDYLRSQGMRLDAVPADGQVVYLRRVANISAGGVSRNVTDSIHPLNAKLAEDVASYFGVTCLGIDVLAEDIAKPWIDAPFAIIEINAAPGVFMHLRPAEGEPVDAPGIIMSTLVPTPRSARIPLICFNALEESLAKPLGEELAWMVSEGEVVGVLRGERLSFDGEHFCCPRTYTEGLRAMLRNPRLAVAVVECGSRHLLHEGHLFDLADIVVLDGPDEIEEGLVRDVAPGGWLVLDPSRPPATDLGRAYPGLNVAYVCRDPADAERLDEFRGLWSMWNREDENVQLFMGHQLLETRRVDDPEAGTDEAVLALLVWLVSRILDEERSEAWG